MKTHRTRLLAGPAIAALLVMACAGAASPEPTSTPTAPPTSPPATATATPTSAPTAEPSGDERGDMRTVEAPEAAITVDGDPSDWDAIEGLELTLEAIRGEAAESKDATVKVAHDGDLLYVLFEVDDDYDWVADDAHLSGSAAVMWGIDPGAGEHMGAEEPDRDTSLGMVDIWHWELECAAGADSGGAVSGPGEGDPGNDAACNLDDEWATIPDEREDDNGDGAENSILGVWSHTNPTEGGAGTWVFEFSRPLETGDVQDGQFTIGAHALMALAYWDPDQSAEGWVDDSHVQSSNQGWIEIHVE